MKKKFAVCFSGYPRFVRKTFEKIKENFLDGLGSYDIFANFQWRDDWKETKIHHAFNDKFEVNELRDFIDLYTPLNVKKIEVIEPYSFDVSNYEKLSLELDMQLTLEQSRDQFYRSKCQYQGILDCLNLIENFDDYEYFVRMRTDLIFPNKIDMKNLETDSILCQNGFVAGWDRRFCDWFFIVPRHQLQFYNDLANLEEEYKDGIVHMHKLIDKLGKPYGMENHEFYVGVPTTTNYLGSLLKEMK